MVKNGQFSIQNVTKHFFQAKCAQKETMKKFTTFDHNHGLTSLEKCKFSDLYKSVFLWSRKASFLSRTLPKHFFRAKCGLKETINQFQVFDQNYELTALEKCKCFRIFDIDVSMVKKGQFSFIKKTINTFSRPNLP